METKLTAGCENEKTDKLPSIFSPKHQPRIQLAGVKTNLYNPVQSTLRRNDIENEQGKLSDEHSRNTLPPGLGNYFLKKTILKISK